MPFLDYSGLQRFKQKMDESHSANPVVTGSISMGRKADTTVGAHSVAVGNNVTASGIYSHAEGNDNIASANASHAEGYQGVASGSYSHVEGFHSEASALASHAEGYRSVASGSYSHAEGASNQASGSYSHVEGGSNLASGFYAHAEGWNTQATGQKSHSEGTYTVANHSNQHVFGTYNVPDSSTNSANANGNYIEIVGNGTSAAQSNARTLDWNGNERLLGDLYFNANTDGSGGTSVSQSLQNKVNNTDFATALQSKANLISLINTDSTWDEIKAKLDSNLETSSLIVIDTIPLKIIGNSSTLTGDAYGFVFKSSSTSFLFDIMHNGIPKEITLTFDDSGITDVSIHFKALAFDFRFSPTWEKMYSAFSKMEIGQSATISMTAQGLAALTKGLLYYHCYGTIHRFTSGYILSVVGMSQVFNPNPSQSRGTHLATIQISNASENDYDCKIRLSNENLLFTKSGTGEQTFRKTFSKDIYLSNIDALVFVYPELNGVDYSVPGISLIHINFDNNISTFTVPFSNGNLSIYTEVNQKDASLVDLCIVAPSDLSASQIKCCIKYLE